MNEIILPFDDDELSVSAIDLNEKADDAEENEFGDVSSKVPGKCDTEHFS